VQDRYLGGEMWNSTTIVCPAMFCPAERGYGVNLASPWKVKNPEYRWKQDLLHIPSCKA